MVSFMVSFRVSFRDSVKGVIGVVCALCFGLISCKHN